MAMVSSLCSRTRPCRSGRRTEFAFQARDLGQSQSAILGVFFEHTDARHSKSAPYYAHGAVPFPALP